MIHELRILPPLAIARFGSAPTPMDNYDVVVDSEKPLGYRLLQPADTFQLDVDSGEITDVFVPDELSFTEDGKVRPVAPFLEVWALTGDEALTGGGQLEPLTTELLEAEGSSVADLRWQVQVANLKVVRRTGDEDDKVVADSGEFADHARRPLVGECEHFLPDKSIGLGHVQFVKPTEAHPQIRLRFTPAGGFVYGSTGAPQDAPAPDPNDVTDVVYDASEGDWDGYRDYPADGPPNPGITAPPQIYAGFDDADRAHVSYGYLDDGCDGVVRVTLKVGDRTLRAFGRVGAGPPTYAPDAVPIRSVADELEQALFGPTVEPADATFERVEEIVRRSFETIRLMNTVRWNVRGMGSPDVPIMDSSLVDSIALENLHQSLLVALRSGTAPWFADVLREYDEAGDFTAPARRKMPAMMRGADAQLMTLTRRQIDLIRTVARGPMFTDGEEDVTGVTPTNLTAQLHHRAAGNLPSTLPDSAVSNCYPGLEFDFRNIWRRVFEGIELHESSGFVVRANPEHSALVGRYLIQVADFTTLMTVTQPDGTTDSAFMEWSNALAEVVANHTGELVPCTFIRSGSAPDPQIVELRVRPLFARSDAMQSSTALIDEVIAQPGELTQSLCSPWQNDYQECGCFYWAASRPDYVNVDSTVEGSVGDRWMAARAEPKTYDVPDFTHQELFQGWEELLRFVVGGKDRE